MTRAPQPSPEDRQKESVLAPAVVLMLFAGLLPVQLTLPGQGVFAGECLTLGNAASRGERPDLTTLERCTALYPTDVELLADLAAAFETFDPVRAETTYRRALDLDPDYADLRLRIARLLMRRGAPADAVLQVEDALRVQPNRAALLDLLAEARLAAEGTPR